MSATTDVDPITTAVIGGALTSIAVDMGYRLTRMSYSSIIRESEDFGCAICDHERRQLCESTQSTPLQSGPLPGYLAGIDRRFAEVGDEWRPGDVVIHNHPYYGASHQPDVAIVIPIFLGDELVGFSATTAHHLDLGALTPGTCGIVDATDAWAEGLLLNAVKVEEEGRPVRSAWRILADNTRLPKLVVGDLEAQVAAARLGVDRMLELVGRFGLETVRAASEQLMDLSEQALRREIEALPDGTYRASGTLDGFLGHPDPAYHDLPIEVAVTVSGSDLHVDLEGTAPQVDLPINMPLVGTVDIAILLTLRAILLDSTRHEPVASNAGLFRPVTISVPEGTIANPAFPAPTIARFCPGNVVADTVMRALAQVRPDAVSAGVGNLKVAAYSGQHAGGAWVYMDIVEGSYGGRPDRDGLDAVDTLYANTRNNPIEDIESHYPLRVRRYELAEGGGGPGRTRGGLGFHPRDRVPRGGRRVARGRRQRDAAARALRRRGGQHRLGDAQPRARRAGPADDDAVPPDGGGRRDPHGRPVGRGLRPAAGARPRARPGRRRPRLPRRRRRAARTTASCSARHRSSPSTTPPPQTERTQA